MPSLPPRPTRLSVTELPFYVFLVTLGLCLFRAADLPSLDIGIGGTTLSIGPADPALLVTGVLAVRELWLRRRVPSPWLLGAIAAFAVLIVLSAIPNSAGAVTAAGKLSDFAVLALGAAAFIDTRQRFADLAWFLVAFCTVAVAWGAVEFVVNGGKRQGSFMGEHDLAALSTMALVLGLAYLFDRDRRPPTVGLVGIVVGAVGIVLGASLASVLGLYLGAVAMVALALVRRDLRRRAVVVSVLICAAVTAGTYGLRSADLGFLQSWFGPPPETPGQYAASWSHRLIYVYIGGRVFLDNPVFGTGWEGELPPRDYAQYLADARERFSDQPPHYFPPETGTLIPQQTWDQVLFELGLVGAVLFVVLVALAIRAAVVAGRRPRPGEPWGEQAYVPLGWLAVIAGAIAGAALFGGSPLAALFWLALGVAAARPVEPEPTT
jgi:O-antigen ligase